MKKYVMTMLIFAVALPLFSYLFDIGDSKGKKEVDGMPIGENDQMSQDEIKKAQQLENLKKQSNEIVRIGLMPFYDLSKIVNADVMLHARLKDAFEKAGFQVSDYRLGKKIKWKKNFIDFERINYKELSEIGKEHEFDYMIIGTINRMSAEKKFRFGNFLSFPIGLGNVLYGEVDFKIKAIRVEDAKEIYVNEFSNKRKNQFGGLYQGSGAVIDRNVKDILNELIDEIKPMMK